eukprot:Skav225365  [mRNA]  locus=scaffold476:5010:12391:- [translate_table: standard]
MNHRETSPWRQVADIGDGPTSPMFDDDEESAYTRDSTSASSAREEPSRWQAKLVFTQAHRGLPTLNRGYRTPDPSPSPLPKCGALQELILMDTYVDHEQPLDSPDVYEAQDLSRQGVTSLSRSRGDTEPWNMAPCRPPWHPVGNG